MDEISIIIADDHPIFRDGLAGVIAKAGGITIAAEGENGLQALGLIQELKPAVAVLDLDMPGLDGFGVAREVRALGLPVGIIILTMHNDESYLNQAIDLGVRGYVLKESAASEIVGAIKMVAAGREYFSPGLSTFLLNRIRQPAATNGIDELTPTERRVMYLLADLKTSKQIGADLGISPRTVENHRARICQKLELQGAHALVKFALQHIEELGRP